jgi:hypothetical protein
MDQDKLDHFQRDHVEPNQGMHHQIIRRYKLFSDIMQRRVVITNVPSSIDKKSNSALHFSWGGGGAKKLVQDKVHCSK